MGKKWLPLEANPDVMTEYVKNLGGPEGLYFVDVLSIEDWALNMITEPIYALILLFPINKARELFEEKQINKIEKEGQIISKKLWFTKQTVGNACGTISILHCIANITDKLEKQPDGFFHDFLSKVSNMSPDQRAKALEEDDDIERAHKKAEKEGQSHIPSRDQKIDTHFITFIEKEGCLYELDGRKKFPINHGASTSKTFFKDAVQIIKTLFIDFDRSELRFQMIAVTGSLPQN